MKNRKLIAAYIAAFSLFTTDLRAAEQCEVSKAGINPCENIFHSPTTKPLIGNQFPTSIEPKT